MQVRGLNNYTDIDETVAEMMNVELENAKGAPKNIKTCYPETSLCLMNAAEQDIPVEVLI